jgi:PAS domain S-box-containing protein
MTQTSLDPSNLDQAINSLSAKVAARTADLRKTNEQLYEEILERRKAERALRATERKYRGFFENAVEGAYQSTPEGQYLSVNPALARMYAYASPSEMMAAIGNIARDIYIDPGMRQRFQEMIERDGEVRNLEYQVRRRDGATRWISENARVARNRRGHVLYYEGTVQDITRRKEAEAEATLLEKQLLQAQKMEAVGTLAGGIAHDFNNILTAINGHAELAKLTTGENPETLEHLARVLQAAGRATDLVRQILAFSRQQEQRRAPLQLRAIVEETLKLLRATIPSTIEFQTSLAADAPLVLADATQVHQVLMNLGTNAWHAMKDRPGRLQVRLEKFEMDAALAASQPRLRPGCHARISVADTGCGIDQATLARIFEPFFTTKPLGEGTGLGLSVVHGIMQSHDGAVTVHSQRSEGTVFHLYFPAHLGAVARVATDAGPIPRGNGQRILFVDDEEVLAKLGQSTLEHLGYRVDCQSNVVDALAAVRGEPQRFALVVTDQTMPRMTGFDFAGELLRLRPDLPIILTTGYSTSQTVERVRAIGIRKLLPKPHTLRALGTAVHEVLSGTARAS